LWADHILDDLLPTHPPFTVIRRGVYRAAELGLPPPDPPDVQQADVLLLHINNFVEYGDAPSPRRLSRLFGERPAFVVRRDGDVPIAMVYRRHALTTRQTQVR
jgi:hypothetical protein